VLIDPFQEESEHFIPVASCARSELPHRVLKCLFELRVQAVNNIFDFDLRHFPLSLHLRNYRTESGFGSGLLLQWLAGEVVEGVGEGGEGDYADQVVV
jgi:hypothetical protein